MALHASQCYLTIHQQWQQLVALLDKGMRIEQVQKLLGHVRIDTTLHYAMVSQQNVKMSHRKYLG